MQESNCLSFKEIDTKFVHAEKTNAEILSNERRERCRCRENGRRRGYEPNVRLYLVWIFYT